MIRLLSICFIVCHLSHRAMGQLSYEGDVITCSESVMMVALTHYGVDFSLGEIRDRLQPGPSGEVTISRLRDGFASYGLVAHAVKGDISSFDRPGELIVALVELEPGDKIGHFVLAMRRTDGDFNVYDMFQSDKPVIISERVLSGYWTGLVMTLGTHDISTGNSFIFVIVSITLLLLCAVFSYIGSRIYQGHHALMFGRRSI